MRASPEQRCWELEGGVGGTGGGSSVRTRASEIENALIAGIYLEILHCNHSTLWKCLAHTHTAPHAAARALPSGRPRGTGYLNWMRAWPAPRSAKAPSCAPWHWHALYRPKVQAPDRGVGERLKNGRSGEPAGLHGSALHPAAREARRSGAGSGDRQERRPCGSESARQRRAHPAGHCPVGLWHWGAADVHVIAETGAAGALGKVAAGLRLTARAASAAVWGLRCHS